MTNEELIKDRAQVAINQLLEILAALPPASPPTPRLQLVWDTDNTEQANSLFSAFPATIKKKPSPLRARRLTTIAIEL